jgi:hypothetical protein
VKRDVIRAGGFLTALLGAIVLAAAGAQGAEYGRCLKAHKHTGAYTDAACTDASAGATGGAYEWFPWGTGKPAQKKATYRAYTNQVFFKTSTGKMECLGENPYGDTFNGEITSPTTGKATVKLEECAGDGSQEDAGSFWKHICSNGETRGGKEELVEFPVVWRLLPGLAAEMEYEIQSPVTLECFPHGGRIRFWGSFGGPVMELGEMSRMSEATLPSQDLEVEVKQESDSAWEAPVPFEIHTGGENHGQLAEFNIVTKLPEKLEIRG